MLLLGAAALVAAGAIGWKAWDANSAAEAGVEVVSDEPLSVEELRDRADASPDNAQVWQELGLAHFQRGEYSEAADAYAKAVSIDSGEAVLWSALGEARVMASERDPLPPEALAAFRKASELDPRDPRARYFLGVKRDIDGEHEGAIADWLALPAHTPPGAPWEQDLVRTIQQVGKINRIETETRIAAAVDGRLTAPQMAGPALRGPTQQQVAAASAMPPGEQRQMAEGMVERLEQRLAGDPSNVDGWLMLIRSRMTLGEPERARQALKDAMAANPSAADRIKAEAAAVGVR